MVQVFTYVYPESTTLWVIHAFVVPFHEEAFTATEVDDLKSHICLWATDNERD